MELCNASYKTIPALHPHAKEQCSCAWNDTNTDSYCALIIGGVAERIRLAFRCSGR